jgi:hypothetical protein
VEDPTALRSLDDWAYGLEDSQHLLNRGSVMRGIGFQKGEGRTDSDGPRHLHPWTDPSLSGPLRYLPDLSTLFQIPWSQKRDGGRVQFRSPDQLESKFEGG